jgi:chemotaxis protein MotB
VSRRAKQHVEETEADERWVISYADLVTLLFGFFLLLYATADQNITKFESLARGLSDAFNVPVNEGLSDGTPLFDGGTGFVPGGESTRDALIENDLLFVQNFIQQRSEEQGLVGKIVVSQEEDGISIRLADNLIFPTASADLRPDALPLLDIAAAAVIAVGREVRVEGHTDNVPLATDEYPSNWELSSARATAVLRYMVEQAGVDPTLIFAAGYGEYRPVASNLTPEGRALNRRADVIILYPPASISADTADPADGSFDLQPDDVFDVTPLADGE